MDHWEWVDCNHLDNTSLDTAHRNSANTSNLVNILEGQTERLVGGTRRRVDGVNSLKESLSGNLGLDLFLPTLVPWAVTGDVDHVVAVEARDGYEGNMLGIVPNLLNEAGGFLDNLVVTILGPFGGVHFVDGNDDLPNTEGICKEERVHESGHLLRYQLRIHYSFLISLLFNAAECRRRVERLDPVPAAIIRIAQSAWESTSNHVLDEITMARGVCKHIISIRFIPQLSSSLRCCIPMTVT